MVKETEHGDHALSPSTGEAETFESLSSQLDWSTEFEASQGHNGTLSKRKSCTSFEMLRKLL